MKEWDGEHLSGIPSTVTIDLEDAADRWWFNEGSGMAPTDGEDQEEHCRRVARIAYIRGAKFGVSISETIQELRDLVTGLRPVPEPLKNPPLWEGKFAAAVEEVVKEATDGPNP